MADELPELPTRCTGTADGQQCFFQRRRYDYDMQCIKCRVTTRVIQAGNAKGLCAKCFDDDAKAEKGWRCKKEGCLEARNVITILQEIRRQNGGDLSSSGESPPIARGNPTAGSSSQVSLPKQALQERMAELQEKVQGIQGQIDEVAVLKEQVKLMQEQIDEVAVLKEQVSNSCSSRSTRRPSSVRRSTLCSKKSTGGARRSRR